MKKKPKIELNEGRDRPLWEGWFKEAEKCNLEDGSLKKFLDHLRDDYAYDYGTYARATAAAAFATASAFARHFGLTMFLWDAAALDIVGKMMFPQNKLGYVVLDYDDILYPQYEERFSHRKISKEGAEDLKKEAQRLLDERKGEMVSEWVVEWWKKLARGEFPKWLEVKE